MAGMEGIVRPFAGTDVTPQRVLKANVRSQPPVRIEVGRVGGTTTFAYSGSASLSTYMAAIHKEKKAKSFNMTTGKVAG